MTGPLVVTTWAINRSRKCCNRDLDFEVQDYKHYLQFSDSSTLWSDLQWYSKEFWKNVLFVRIIKVLSTFVIEAFISQGLPGSERVSAEML